MTARKREERGQDVPASLNVFSGAGLEAAGVRDLEDLQYRTPGLKVTTGTGAASLAIRGISNNASPRGGGPSTAVHLDGVYLSRPSLALTEIFDVNRVEVLKGPEGTLYGRNATAGVVNYVTRDPNAGSRAEGFIGGGSFGLLRAQAAGNLLAGDAGGLRISAATSRDDGYTKNLAPAGGRLDARDFKALRLKGNYALTPDVDLSVTLQSIVDKGTVGTTWSENPATPNYVTSLKPPQRSDPRHIALDTPPSSKKQGTLAAVNLTANLGGGITLKSITGFVHYQQDVLSDSDGTGGFIENASLSDTSNFFSQEFQLSGGTSKGLSWTSGIYLSRERTSGSNGIVDSNFYPSDLSPFPIYDQRNQTSGHSVAVFGEATYALTQQTSVLVGGRYTKESLTGTASGSAVDFTTFQSAPFSGGGTAESSKFTPKVLLQHKLTPDTMLYGSVTTGFKSGGVNLSPPIQQYKPEKITAYEFGTKNQFASGTVELDAAAFYYDYKDLQLRTVVGNQTPISNASGATIKGLELTLIARPTRELAMDFSGAYLDSKLKNYVSPATGADLSGLPLPMAPKVSATAGVQYRVALGSAGAVTLRAEVNHQSLVIFPGLQDPTNTERQGPVTLVNANLRYSLPDSRSYFSLIGRNLTNRLYLTNRSNFAGFSDVESYGPPRTVELRFGTAF